MVAIPQPLRQSGITLGLFPYRLGQQGAIAIEIELRLGAGDAGIDQLTGQSGLGLSGSTSTVWANSEPWDLWMVMA